MPTRTATMVRPFYGSTAHIAMVEPFALNGRTPTMTALCGATVRRTTTINVATATPCKACKVAPRA